MTKGGAKRPVKDAEAELFARALSDAKPLRHRPGLPELFIKPPSRSKFIAGRNRDVEVSGKPYPAISVKGRAAVMAMDGRNAERLIKGRMEIEGRIDLHGHTHEAARHILMDFIRRNHAYGKRCVLVITGKGRSQQREQHEDTPVHDRFRGRFSMPERKGMLFDLVPVWLSAPELAQYVVAFYPAQPKHGGNGALYVYLRRALEG